MCHEKIVGSSERFGQERIADYGEKSSISVKKMKKYE